ncbi:hypothetical protein ES703_47172 [subsurface metagenome]
MADKLASFDWRSTRLVTLTIDPGQFKDGQDALEYVKEHKSIAGFIRNLKRVGKVKRGKEWMQERKPVKVTKWIGFLEWHKNGYPHWHLLVEVKEQGIAGRIGQDVIHYYWPLGKIIHETPIRSLKQWKNMVGYFGAHGYFKGDKDHQTTLPSWAMDIKGLRIRRVYGSRMKQKEDQRPLPKWAKEVCREFIDPETGEILKRPNRSYRELLASCGKRTFIRIHTGKKLIQGIFDIPYREILDAFKGEHLGEGGYAFSTSIEEADKISAKMIRGKVIQYPERTWINPQRVIHDYCDRCGDVTYQKYQYVRESVPVYQCLRCKIIHIWKGNISCSM